MHLHRGCCRCNCIWIHIMLLRRVHLVVLLTRVGLSRLLIWPPLRLRMRMLVLVRRLHAPSLRPGTTAFRFTFGPLAVILAKGTHGWQYH